MLPFPLKLDGIEVDQGTVNMEEIITINDEMHFDCGLGIAKYSIDIRKCEIRIPLPEVCLSEVIQPFSVF
jgi:hypothetical protein